MTRMLPCRPAVGLALVAAMVAGCGGGDDDEVAAQAPAGASAPAPGAASAPTPTAVSTCGQPDFAATALARLNERRAAGADCGSSGRFGAAGAVRWSERLALAADGHSRDMAAGNYFSHTSADGRTLSVRIDAQGYAWSRIGENLAAGTATVASTVDGWMASPGHCANIMAAAFVEVGLACVAGTPANTYRTYWTLTLGTPR